ncbi:YeeE/YedE thiosulfate transporter family protein [Methanoregula sp.]|uniref:YeeE/YedE thiosulfate transporter family protein n=1 Tax=Methanoregula sp. TaxID=2052170 RepID=UPI000CAF5ED1|nr:YeeE/YedE thiosulfate transporter family protein [Methanoregula sp.]PKG31516.1 MAG: transporter component [Methanoregula sp.]
MALAGLLSKDAAVIAVPVVTLILGILIGWLGQRSGFCSIGGFRDFIMFRHTRLLSGFLALIVGAFVGFLAFKILFPAAFEGFFWLLGKGLAPVPGAPAGLADAGYILLALIGGIAVGLIGVLLGGCPLRQLVMTAEGNIKSLCFVIGMCIGSVVFTLWVSGWVVMLLKSMGLGA